MSQHSSNPLAFLADQSRLLASPPGQTTGGAPGINATTRWTATKVARSRGLATVAMGRKIGIISGIIWVALNNAGMIYSLGQYSRMSEAFARQDFDALKRDSQSDALLVTWFVATAGQLSVAGVFSGLAIVIFGYANLFLEKQSVFEQHVNEQMTILATASHIGALQVTRGNASMGDQFNVGGDVTGAALGRHASVLAEQMSIIKQTLDRSQHVAPELKEAITSATAEVEKLDLPDVDKEDVAENLKKCADELDKPAPESGRVVRFIRRIEELAPTVATILKSVSTLAGFFGP